MTRCLYDARHRTLHAVYTRCKLDDPVEFEVEAANPESTALCDCLIEDDSVPDEALNAWGAV
jgi:hypothetical protein